MDSSEGNNLGEEAAAMYTSECMDDEDDDSEGWDEMVTDNEPHLICLFCPKSFKTIAVALEHCKTEHSFDLVSIKDHYNMDCYSYICLINYVRSTGCSAESLTTCKEPPWINDKYMKPVIQDDPWLMFDFEDVETSLQSDILPEIATNIINKENGLVTISERDYIQFIHSIQLLNSQVRERDAALALASEKISQMKLVTQNILSNDCSSQNIESKMSDVRINDCDDEGYFNTYSHFSIHHEMLSDKVRTLGYRDAILNNPLTFTNKTVLDLGCGTSILSMFAANAGASKVIGIDQSDIIYNAMDIVRENNLSDKIYLVKDRIENAKLDIEQFDVIVSEWMGYFLLFEAMLDSFIFARGKYLKPGGLLLPNRCTLSIVGVSDIKEHGKLISFWSDVYGFKMSCLQKEVIREAVISEVPSTSIATSPAQLLDLNLYNSTVDSVNFTSDFCLECQVDGPITALAGYFDSFFDLPVPVVINTGPNYPVTHWKQTVFYLPQPLPVNKGDKIVGTLQCKRGVDDKRSLEVRISLNGQNLKYFLS